MSQEQEQVKEGKRQATVFFSYAHADRPRAVEVIRVLENAGYTVWWDGHLEGGVRYVETIEDALETATAVVVLWSKESVGSNWVRDEANSGAARGRLVPLTIDGVAPPLGFRQFQAIDLTKWEGEAGAVEADQMLRAIASLHDGADIAPPKRAPSAGAHLIHVIKRRRLLTGGAAAAVALAAGAAIWRPFSKSNTLAGNGIVVLPFDNVSGDPEQNYMSAGLAAELRAILARNDALRVVASSSSDALKSRNLDAVSIARELGVAFILEGSVRIAGDALRVSSELIDGKTGFSQWSQTFDETMSDILGVQRDIATAVSSALSLKISAVANTFKIGATANPAAYNEYLKGVDLYRAAISTETDMQSLAHLDAATRIDPDFAAAHAARARTLTALGNTSDDVRKAQLYYQSALSAAEEAAALAPDLDDAQSTLGMVLFQSQLKVKEAFEPYERSHRLGTGSAAIQARYATYASLTGRDADAMAALDRAVILDPLNPTVHRAVGLAHYVAGRYEKAIDAVEDALALNDKLSDAQAIIAAALVQMDRAQEAIEACEKETFDLSKYAGLAIAYWRAGDTASAEASYKALVDDYGDAGLYQQAQVLAQWERPDDAMTILAKAYDAGDSGLVYLKTDPMLRALRSRTDFIELQKTLGFA